MPTRIERLASNSTMYYRGDSCMEISPFTNYYLFTVYKESNDEVVDDHIPLNLTNLGTIWLSFINGDNKVRISNYLDADNIDYANGEVVFRISSEDASRILSMSNKTFYISSSIGDGTTSSDETVLFSGSWVEYSSAMRTSLTDTVQELKNTIQSLNNKMTSDLNEWTNKLNDANNQISTLKSENDRLSAQIIELENKLSQIDDSYIDATIITDDKKIPVSSDDNTANIAKLETAATSLERTSLVSSFTYDNSTGIADTVTNNNKKRR